MKLLIEAIAVGISMVLIGTVVSLAVSATTLSVDLPRTCKEWNQFYVMEISLFLTGFVAHLGFELLQVNRWYCKHGNACRTRNK